MKISCFRKCRVFIKYCVFSKNFQYFLFLASTGLLLVVQPIMWLYTQISCTDGLLPYMQGMSCSEFGKNAIFNEHPVNYIQRFITFSQITTDKEMEQFFCFFLFSLEAREQGMQNTPVTGSKCLIAGPDILLCLQY